MPRFFAYLVMILLAFSPLFCAFWDPATDGDRHLTQLQIICIWTGSATFILLLCLVYDFTEYLRVMGRDQVDAIFANYLRFRSVTGSSYQLFSLHRRLLLHIIINYGPDMSAKVATRNKFMEELIQTQEASGEWQYSQDWSERCENAFIADRYGKVEEDPVDRRTQLDNLASSAVTVADWPWILAVVCFVIYPLILIAVIMFQFDIVQAGLRRRTSLRTHKERFVDLKKLEEIVPVMSGQAPNSKLHTNDLTTLITVILLENYFGRLEMRSQYDRMMIIHSRAYRYLSNRRLPLSFVDEVNADRVTIDYWL